MRHVKAASGTDSSGLACAPRSHKHKMVDLADGHYIVEGNKERRISGEEGVSECHTIQTPAGPPLQTSPIVTPSAICPTAKSDGSLVVGTNNDSNGTSASIRSMSQSGIYLSRSGYIVSDTNAYEGRGDLGVYDFNGYGYDA